MDMEEMKVRRFPKKTFYGEALQRLNQIEGGWKRRWKRCDKLGYDLYVSQGKHIKSNDR